VASKAMPRIGSRAVMVAGLLLAAAGALLLTRAPADADYLRDLLPGLLALGAGIGATFVSVSVTALHDVDHARAGLASGLMSTAHELGGALGVAVLAAVATAGAKAGGIAIGYGDGFRVATGIALALAALAAATVPSVRPKAGAGMPMH
jgi:fucose permease